MNPRNSRLKLEEIKQVLEIDATSPSGLRWIVDNHKMRAGDMAGSLKRKYYHVMIKGIHYLNHRIIYALAHGLELSKLPKYIDHMDRNPSNNIISNLRQATRSQNLANSNTRKDNTSGIKGVSWCKAAKKWRSRISIKGKEINLGLFEHIKDAENAYKVATVRFYGKFIIF